MTKTHEHDPAYKLFLELIPVAPAANDPKLKFSKIEIIDKYLVEAYDRGVDEGYSAGYDDAEAEYATEGE